MTKPVKIVFEGDCINDNCTYGTLSDITVAQRIIRDMWANRLIKTVIYRTLKGQLSHGNLNDVLNFIRKNGYFERYEKYDRQTMTYTIKKSYPVSINSRMGIIELK
jgi:hypothetical protein